VGRGRAGSGPDRNGGCSGIEGAPPADRGGLNGAGLLRAASSPAAAAGVPGTPGPSCPPVAGAWAVASESDTGPLATCEGCSAVLTGAGNASWRAGRSWVACSSADSGSETATEVSASRRIAAPAPPCTLCRINSATGSSIELEWVFFSLTPSSGNMSMMACEGISSCLASSLIRILLINSDNTGRDVSSGPPLSSL
jgi:hypothetical protein